MDKKQGTNIFSGNIFIFQAFDVGEEVDLARIAKSNKFTLKPLSLPKYFKNYHIPLAIDLQSPDNIIVDSCASCKIHAFGAISLTYKIPLADTLENIRAQLLGIEEDYQEKSFQAAQKLYKVLKPYILKPTWFHPRSSYFITQIDPKPEYTDISELKQKYEGIIASMVRFETEVLSEYQKNEILDSAIGYFRGDLIIIDPDSAFVYDAEYEEILDFFEFANIQLLELRYFDWILDQQLNVTYEEKTKLPLKSYLPFIRTTWKGPVADLQQLRVDISVISERLENSIKFVGEAYFLELYGLLIEKLDLESLKKSINRKLEIVSDIRSAYQHKIDAIREDLLSMLIIILIFIEVILAIYKK